MKIALFFAFLTNLMLVAHADDSGSWVAHERAVEDLNHISRGDIAFFFDVVAFRNGQWEFKLSPNVRGMLWRVRKDKTDVTAACESGQVLDVLPGSSLELKGKGTRLFCEPRGLVGFHLWLTLETKIDGSNRMEQREALMEARQGGFALMFSED